MGWYDYTPDYDTAGRAAAYKTLSDAAATSGKAGQVAGSTVASLGALASQGLKSYANSEMLKNLYRTEDVVTNQAEIDKANKLQELRTKEVDKGTDVLFDKLDAQEERLLNAGKPTPMEESPITEKTIPLPATDIFGRTNARGGKTVEQQNQERNTDDAKSIFSSPSASNGGGRRGIRENKNTAANTTAEAGTPAAQKAKSTAKTATRETVETVENGTFTPSSAKVGTPTDILNKENKSIMDTYGALNEVEGKKVVIPKAVIEQETRLVEDYEKRIMGSRLPMAEKISLIKQLEPKKASIEALNLKYKRGNDKQTIADAQNLGYKGSGVEAAKEYLNRYYSKKSGGTVDIFSGVQDSFWNPLNPDKDDVVKFVVKYRDAYRPKDLKAATTAATSDGVFDKNSFLEALKLYKAIGTVPK